MKILVVVPAYNEAQTLPSLLKELRACQCDVVVVNDASTDSTEEVVRKAKVPVLSLPVNLGIGGGVQAGFLYAVRQGYDVVVQIDGDGQHDPGRLADVVTPIIEKKADCVIGSRYLPSKPDDGYITPFFRKMGMRFSTAILRMTTGLTVHDTTSGYRALSREAFSFFSTEYPVDHPEAEALLLLHQAGFRILEVPTKMRCRVAGASLFTFTKAALYPLRVIVGFIGFTLKAPRRGSK